MTQMLAEGMEPERARQSPPISVSCVDRIADYNSTFTSWVPGAK